MCVSVIMYLCMYIGIYARSYVTCAYACFYVCICIMFLHVCLCVCMFVCMFVGMFVCMCVCIYVYMYLCEFLIGRSFNVCINSCASKLFNVSSFVPHSSKLGPLLYILFRNDITQIFNFSSIKMYADDIYASINNNNDRNELQNELDLFCEWCSKWSLAINIKKRKLRHFCHSNNYFQNKLNDTNLEISDCECIQGVHFDNKLTFGNRVYLCIKKACNVCNCFLSNVY